MNKQIYETVNHFLDQLVQTKELDKHEFVMQLEGNGLVVNLTSNEVKSTVLLCFPDSFNCGNNSSALCKQDFSDANECMDLYKETDVGQINSVNEVIFLGLDGFKEQLNVICRDDEFGAATRMYYQTRFASGYETDSVTWEPYSLKEFESRLLASNEVDVLQQLDDVDAQKQIDKLLKEYVVNKLSINALNDVNTTLEIRVANVCKYKKIGDIKSLHATKKTTYKTRYIKPEEMVENFKKQGIVVEPNDLSTCQTERMRTPNIAAIEKYLIANGVPKDAIKNQGDTLGMGRTKTFKEQIKPSLEKMSLQFAAQATQFEIEGIKMEVESFSEKLDQEMMADDKSQGLIKTPNMNM